MPLGFTRLNEAKQRPNQNVNFFKPLEGPDKDASLEFLSRIAAIAAPIMRQNHCLVNSLEEFPPNREFWGRNFNAGECIQIVLKSPSTGRWLPRRFVEMVFMHELAHCKQMNHSRAFWQVRNAYSAELRDLWIKNYVGDGVWGQGHSLCDGQLTHEALPPADEEMVRNLCGGTYQGARRRRKRASKPQLTYAERKQKRIAKKFGTGGQELGNDEEARSKLQNGKKVKGTPRVASSNRGRELRAAALLERLQNAKMEEVKAEENDSDTEDESDYEELPHDANEVVDSNGKRFIQICEGEDGDHDDEAKKELQELFQSEAKGKDRSKTQDTPKLRNISFETPEDINNKDIKSSAGKSHATQYDSSLERSRDGKNAPANINPDGKKSINSLLNDNATPGNRGSISHLKGDNPMPKGIEEIPNNCPICSLINSKDALTCAACGHVIWPDKLPGTWKCEVESCNGRYVNHKDNSICGLCGAPKQVS